MSYFKGFGSKSRSFGGRKLPLVGLILNQNYSIFNEYVPGSGVGASNITTRRFKKKRAKIAKCVKKKSDITILNDDEIIKIDNYASRDKITQIIQANPLSNIDLDSNSNLSTDIDTILAVATEMSSTESGITEKMFFSNYDIISNTDIIAKLKEEFEVSTAYTATTITDNQSYEFIFILEFINNSDGTSFMLTEQINYT